MKTVWFRNKESEQLFEIDEANVALVERLENDNNFEKAKAPKQVAVTKAE